MFRKDGEMEKRKKKENRKKKKKDIVTLKKTYEMSAMQTVIMGVENFSTLIL